MGSMNLVLRPKHWSFSQFWTYPWLWQTVQYPLSQILFAPECPNFEPCLNDTLYELTVGTSLENRYTNFQVLFYIWATQLGIEFVFWNVRTWCSIFKHEVIICMINSGTLKILNWSQVQIKNNALIQENFQERRWRKTLERNCKGLITERIERPKSQGEAHR